MNVKPMLVVISLILSATVALAGQDSPSRQFHAKMQQHMSHMREAMKMMSGMMANRAEEGMGPGGHHPGGMKDNASKMGGGEMHQGMRKGGSAKGGNGPGMMQKHMQMMQVMMNQMEEHHQKRMRMLSDG